MLQGRADVDVGLRRRSAGHDRACWGAWPNDAVAHTYGSAGTFPVVVTTEWQAWFTVDGLGPFPVEGPPVARSAIRCHWSLARPEPSSSPGSHPT